MFSSTNPFGQSSSSPFGSPSVFGQTNNASNNPFAPKPFGSSTPFGSQTGGSLFGGTSTGVFGAAQSSSPFSSTTTFGASSSPAFGSTMPAFGASSTPAFGSSSSSFGGSSVFGQKPAFGGFGSSPTQTSPFGSTNQQSQPAFGSSIFGASTPFGATSQPAFGASSTPAFGATSTPAFGSTNSPAFGATSTPGTPSFGASSTPAFGSTASPAFGNAGTSFGVSNAPVFGSGGAFGASSSPMFGSSSTSVFGTSTAPAFGASSTPAFGSSSTSAFGASSTPAFGASSTPSFSFGSSPAFGQSASAFGSSPFGATTPFAAQSSPFGAPSTTPAFGSTGFGQSPFGSQRGGSRVAAFTPTTEADGGKLESISAMPVYKDKSHEELRWEDYQIGDKGGPLPAGQPVGGIGFSSSPANSNLLAPSPTFGQSAASPFSSSMTSNPFAPKTPSIGGLNFGSSATPTISSSPFGASTSSGLFGSTSLSTSSTFGVGPSPSIFGSSSLFSSSQATNGGFGSNTQSSPLFQSNAPSIGQTGSAFGQTTTSYGQNTSSPFGQGILGASTTPGFGVNTFSSTSSLISSSNALGFGQSNPSFSMPFQQSQPAQTTTGFGLSSYGATQPGGGSPFGGMPGILGQTQSNIGQLSAPQSSAVVQPVPATNPFGTLPAMPQMSIGRVGTSPSIQYGISTLPVVDKPAPVRISSLLTSRHLSQRRMRLPARKYHTKNDGPKVPFFSDDEEPSTPKADALFIPRENPRALVIRPTEQWPMRASAEKASASKDISTPVHENGKIYQDAQGGSNSEDKDKNPVENGFAKEGVHILKGNQKPNGVHEDHSGQKGDSYMTLSGHRAGEAAIVYEHGADIEALMPKLRRSDYYTEPRIQELAAKERAEPGFCRHVKDFVVGRHGYGSIKFLGETDVRRLDLEALVQFNNREVIVYMDDSKKPPVGQGLNKPAEVTLLNIKCFDKKTGKQYTEGPKIEKYKEMLKRKAEDQGAEFVSYDPIKGEWKFRVNHF
ncbi:nuclear pore complex protein NUP98A [Corylus avellana]|uniref:nuclear pore complex protein NUP98A n=1 Tax=Corylus avellana TaxID=13451 RepID=UPI00286C72EB|nr:nuclear pore complex protein NUP98A [Corylus avellana]